MERLNQLVIKTDIPIKRHRDLLWLDHNLHHHITDTATYAEARNIVQHLLRSTTNVRNS